MNLAFELLFSGRSHNHSLSENLEKCLVDLDLRPSSRGAGKAYFLFSTAYKDRSRGGFYPLALIDRRTVRAKNWILEVFIRRHS